MTRLFFGAGHIRPALAPVLCATLALTACSGVTGNARVEAVEASGDGTLRVGMILDNSGANSFLNAPQLAAAKLAVKEINVTGGHKGRPVELLPVESGEDPAAQAQALVQAKADVVVGPTDSSHAAAAIDILSRARTPLISPANTAASLSTIPSGGYYFRTAAADIAQAPVLVKLAKDAGAATIAVMYQDGSYGSDVSAAVSDAAEQAGVDVAALEGFASGDAGSAVSAIRDAGPDAVILIARDGAQGALAELHNADLAGSRILLSDGAFARYGSKLGTKALEGARAAVPGGLPSAGLQERLLGMDPGLKDVSFAAETYDAVILAALAAARAEDDAGRSIAANLIAVSGGTSAQPAKADAKEAGAKEPGAPCASYKECLAVKASGAEMNYDGESGPVAFDANGDITSAAFTIFTFGADNIPAVSGRETAGRAAG
ncbi:amino acid/amide ABC transporter substrate-binding protein, HAAT family [Pseudarthrobacter phenanthrenivorans Sphe3]|uniref:Amino acid/amide ABC transporter substrate-binding protein, HAAT family n=1 Tax=Pseudarthrobacter phenanthrenivorans (strain DSM 18606 / JCM 16027 / LMG 23796 / Sphe3) TaxID=930171 RepID=F0M1R6_PSEPM|nr:amino acid/amide ABC transporter substrate-binding protein, HAAT family [Pseudarthrobacter phenanthrenivorans Sphe3]